LADVIDAGLNRLNARVAGSNCVFDFVSIFLLEPCHDLTAEATLSDPLITSDAAVLTGATFILSIVAPASMQAQACAREVTIERCIPIEYLLVSMCAARIPSSVAGN
jgi:hypothetical protein